MVNRKILVLVTDHFPCGTGEPFLETEIQYYRGFDKILIFPSQYAGKKRKLPPKFIVCHSERETKLLSPTECGALLEELLFLLKNKRENRRNFADMVMFYQKAQKQAEMILVQLKSLKISRGDKVVIYSYWMNENALAAVMAAERIRGCRTICRCHRIDLYEECSNGYLPFRSFLLKKLSYVLPVSRDGKQYLLHKYGNPCSNIFVCRLGTVGGSRKSAGDGNLDRTILRMVSCSSLIMVKRVYLIVEILSLIKDIKVEWTHFGGGAQFHQISKMCRERLGKNVTCHLRGQMTNSEILEQYAQQPYHLFVNVSASEGVPVSIMEAMSYGIPVLATNVGGVSEIVKQGKTGCLLKKDFQPSEAAAYIHRIYEMSWEEYQNLRRQNRYIWKQSFNADKNYRKFANLLLKLVGENPDE